MIEKLKSILNRELTSKETALVAVFFIALTIFIFNITSESETIESEKISKKSHEKIDHGKFEIVRTESKLPKFDPFSKDHLTREKISELKSQPKIAEKSEIVAEKSETEISKLEDSIVEDLISEENSEDQMEDQIFESKKIPPIKLKGIIFANEKSIAIVEFNGEHDLMLGDSIGDWKIIEINHESIVLDSGDLISLDSGFENLEIHRDRS